MDEVKTITARKVLIKKWEKSTHCKSVDTSFIEDVVYPAMEEYANQQLNEIGKDVEHLHCRRVCFFTRKDKKYLDQNNEEITVEMLMNHDHAIHDQGWSYIILD